MFLQIHPKDIKDEAVDDAFLPLHHFQPLLQFSQVRHNLDHLLDLESGLGVQLGLFILRVEVVKDWFHEIHGVVCLGRSLDDIQLLDPIEDQQSQWPQLLIYISYNSVKMEMRKLPPIS